MNYLPKKSYDRFFSNTKITFPSLPSIELIQIECLKEERQYETDFIFIELIAI
jgi:hypothetical protein